MNIPPSASPHVNILVIAYLGRATLICMPGQVCQPAISSMGVKGMKSLYPVDVDPPHQQVPDNYCSYIHRYSILDHTTPRSLTGSAIKGPKSEHAP